MPRPARIALALLLPVFWMTGCAHQAKKYVPPNRVPVTQAAEKLRARVTEAKRTAQEARRSVVEVKGLVLRQRPVLAADAAKLADLLRSAPPELREPIMALQASNAEQAQRLTELEQKVNAVMGSQTSLQTQLETSIPKAEEELAKANETYFLDADRITEKANIAEAGWHKDSAEIVRIKTSSWVTKILTGLGVVALGLMGFLWFTGRIASSAARVATALSVFLVLSISGCASRNPYYSKKYPDADHDPDWLEHSVP